MEEIKYEIGVVTDFIIDKRKIDDNSLNYVDYTSFPNAFNVCYINKGKDLEIGINYLIF